jgi:hypothetical protein
VATTIPRGGVTPHSCHGPGDLHGLRGWPQPREVLAPLTLPCIGPLISLTTWLGVLSLPPPIAQWPLTKIPPSYTSSRKWPASLPSWNSKSSQCGTLTCLPATGTTTEASSAGDAAPGAWVRGSGVTALDGAASSPLDHPCGCERQAFAGLSLKSGVDMASRTHTGTSLAPPFLLPPSCTRGPVPGWVCGSPDFLAQEAQACWATMLAGCYKQFLPYL